MPCACSQKVDQQQSCTRSQVSPPEGPLRHFQSHCRHGSPSRLVWATAVDALDPVPVADRVERALRTVQLHLVELAKRRRLVGHDRYVERAGRAGLELKEDHRRVLGGIVGRAVRPRPAFERPPKDRRLR